MHRFKKLKNGIPIGTIIPFKQWNGNVGIWAENYLIDKKHKVNRSSGPDLFGGLEVKTRNLESAAPYSIGGMTRDYIINTSYDNSILRLKCQQWYLVTFIDSQSIVVDAFILDLFDKHTQQLLEHDYEVGRAALIKNPFKSYTGSPNTSWGYFEKRQDRIDQYQFRVSNKGIQSIMGLNDKVKFKELFIY